MMRIRTLIVGLLFCVGCSSAAEVPSVTEAPHMFEALATPVLVDVHENTLTLTSLVHDSQTSSSIHAPGVQEATVSHNGQQVFWVAHNDAQVYRLERRSAGEEGSDVLYSSSQAIEDIAVSADNTFVSFIEANEDGHASLYIVDTHTRRVNRVAERIREYVWSPQETALAYVTDTQSTYVIIDERGQNVSPIQLSSEEQLWRGLAFADAARLYGIVEVSEQDEREEDLSTTEMYMEMNLRTGEQVELFEFLPATAHTVGGDVRTFVTEDGEFLLTQQLKKEGKVGMVTLYSSTDKTTETISLAANMLGVFVQDQTHVVVLATVADTADTDDERWDLQLLPLNSASETPERVAQDLHAPTLAY